MKKHLFRKETLAGYAFIAPNFIGFLIFTLLPVIASLILAFMHWDLLSWPPKWAGIDNFVNLLWFHREGGRVVANDPYLWKYCFNTVFFMMAIPIGMALSLGLAMVMNQKFRGMVLYRTIFFLPSLTAGIALYILWKWIFNHFGLFNWGLSIVGISGPDWLTDIHWAKPAMMIMMLWTGMGGTGMILYLAGLQGIPPTLYEAAKIDGASGWQQFRHITWPMLSPTTFFISIMGVIGGFQGGFEMANVMTKGGPAGATKTISYYIYENAFIWHEMGYAAGIAWFLFVVVFLMTLLCWRFGGSVVHYD